MVKPSTVMDTPLAYAFFRDISSTENVADGREHHAAGLVLERANYNSLTRRDVTVMYLHPFRGTVQRKWRSDSAIEIYEAGEAEWKHLMEVYQSMERSVVAH